MIEYGKHVKVWRVERPDGYGAYHVPEILPCSGLTAHNRPCAGRDSTWLDAAGRIADATFVHAVSQKYRFVFTSCKQMRQWFTSEYYPVFHAEKFILKSFYVIPSHIADMVVSDYQAMIHRDLQWHEVLTYRFLEDGTLVAYDLPAKPEPKVIPYELLRY